jgi:hypothetical protein
VNSRLRQLCALLCWLGWQGMLRPAAAHEPGEPYCSEWSAKAAALPTAKALMLQKYGVVWQGELLLSERFKESCEFRVRLGAYWGRIISGNILPSDAAFGSANSAKICSVLRTMWPVVSNASASTGDGEFDSDRYNMLGDPNLREKDLVPVLASILATDHIGLDLTAAIMTRKMTTLRYGLWGEFLDAPKRHDVKRHIYSLACLQRIGEDIGRYLKTLSSSRFVTEEQRRLVQALQEILPKRGLVFSDVEALGYDGVNGRWF